MEITNLLFVVTLTLALMTPEICSESDINDERTTKSPPGFNPLEDLILNQDENGFKPGSSLSRHIRQIISENRDIEKGTESPPGYNPLEDLILHQDKKGFSDVPLSRMKRQYRDYRYRYYPIPILVGGGFGGFGGFGRGYNGRGFGGRGFGGRGFGGRGIGGRGFGGRGFGGRGIGGRGIGGGIGGRGIGGGRGGGRG